MKVSISPRKIATVDRPAACFRMDWKRCVGGDVPDRDARQEQVFSAATFDRADVLWE
jgi:hypothetical protein